MTPEAQRIAIAEICGWERNAKGYWKRPGTRGYDWSSVFIPSYSTSLDAMYEAEQVLDAIQRREFVRLLHPDKHQHHFDADWTVCHATAAQRAEAFLRTLGKWKDDSP